LKITNIRPVTDSGGGRFRDVAVFDAEVVDGLRLVGLRLSTAPDGKRFVFAPAKHGVRFAQFTGDYAKGLAEAAHSALGGRVANANR
jgi:hypothetical protein